MQYCIFRMKNQIDIYGFYTLVDDYDFCVCSFVMTNIYNLVRMIDPALNISLRSTRALTTGITYVPVRIQKKHEKLSALFMINHVALLDELDFAARGLKVDLDERTKVICLWKAIAVALRDFLRDWQLTEADLFHWKQTNKDFAGRVDAHFTGNQLAHYLFTTERRKKPVEIETLLDILTRRHSTQPVRTESDVRSLRSAHNLSQTSFLARN
jgi:hypothetical protein